MVSTLVNANLPRGGKASAPSEFLLFTNEPEPRKLTGELEQQAFFRSFSRVVKPPADATPKAK